MKRLLVTLIVISFIGSLQGLLGKPGYGPGDQDWGWYQVRDGAHMFYWLFYTQAADVDSFYDRPLVIWLQGGPGGSSIGYGNFLEIGQLFVNGTERPSSWVNYVNVMFIDNPVGTGFSYVQPGSHMPSNNEEIGADMVQFLIKFYEGHSEFSNVPMYIFGESYGGKMAVEVAKQLVAAIETNQTNVDFRGVGLGDAWISPIDSCLTYAPYLLHTGFVDQEEHDEIAKGAQLIQDTLDGANYKQATWYWNVLLGYVVDKHTGNISIYNVLEKVKYSEEGHRYKREIAQHILHRRSNHYGDIQELIQTEVRQALGISEDVKYNFMNDEIYDNLYGDFMKPVTCVVEELLNSTNLKVVVYNGQLDLIVTTLGTLRWVDRLQWSGSSGWKSASKDPLVINGIIEGYVKNHENLYLYWINRAGHSVPTDNPEAGVEILRRLTEFDKKNFNLIDFFGRRMIM